MDIFIRIAGAAMLGAVMCMALRMHTGPIALLLSLIICVMIFTVSLHLFQPVVSILEKIRALTGLSSAATAPLLKAAGIGFISQIAGAVCEDAGEKALAKAVDTSGALLSIYAALPILDAVLELLKDALGGAN